MVEESHLRSAVITGTQMIEKPAGSESPTIAEEQTGVVMPKRTIALVLSAVLLAAGAAMWATRARRNPAACPYSQRLFLDLPRPFMRRQTLRDMLDLAPGERVLEVGAGTGYYSLDVARQIAPEGRLDVLDLQQSMLDELDAPGTDGGTPISNRPRVMLKTYRSRTRLSTLLFSSPPLARSLIGTRRCASYAGC